MNYDLINQDQDKSKNNIKIAVRDYLIVNCWNAYPAWAQNMYCLKKGEYPLWVCIVDKGRKPTAEQMAFINLVNSLTLCGTRAIWCDSLEMFIPVFNDLINGYGINKTRETNI